ncbi:hypothetical protein EWM64_g1180 [Hericium alpestre]|uniref:Hydantoinase A/oxoprolinase domain-containing protein n=1 Tax=Hericium alpestre TaxID=135208 RepID=A0A4Z0A912_9AGAM|nr:hypothetical protein EWM64_g1180 [Hericium alpestre]
MTGEAAGEEGDRSQASCVHSDHTFALCHLSYALLERKGHKHALPITKGFKDLLLIGNQSCPWIFDLNIRRPPPLYSTIVEVDERVTLVGYTSDPQSEEHKVLFNEDGTVKRGYRGKGWDGQGDAEGPGETVQGISGEAFRILTKPAAPHDQDGPARVSSTADAYLTPILRDYLDGLFQGFDKSLHERTHNAHAPDKKGRAPRVQIMGSDGGLVDVKGFSGLKSILSGPTGGVVGYALTSWDEERKTPIIGYSFPRLCFESVFYNLRDRLDVGGMLTDLDINTVAAGGGSCLTFRNGLFNCGPESTGADPSPACYRRGGPLTVTDANLLLGRIIPSYFPKIFGKDADESLDADMSKAAFEKLAKQINEDQHKHLGLDEIVYGCISGITVVPSRNILMAIMR